MTITIDCEDLCTRARTLNITLSDAQLAQFELYAKLLHEWNERLNLTTVPPAEYVERHFLDSLSLAALPQWNGSARIADIGSGAGFPGIPLKIAFPELNLVIVESLQKRCNFLTEVANQLGLTNLSIMPERGEVAAHSPQLRESFDIVTARAVAHLRILSEILLPYAKLNGTIAALKGNQASSEIEESLGTITRCGGAAPMTESVTIPHAATPSTIVVIGKIAPSPTNIPRSYAAITKRPLTA